MCFFVFLESDINQLTDKANQLNQEIGLTLFSTFSGAPDTHKYMIEIQVGSDHKAISDAEIVAYLTSLFV